MPKESETYELPYNRTKSKSLHICAESLRQKSKYEKLYIKVECTAQLKWMKYKYTHMGKRRVYKSLGNEKGRNDATYDPLKREGTKPTHTITKKNQTKRSY